MLGRNDHGAPDDEAHLRMINTVESTRDSVTPATIMRDINQYAEQLMSMGICTYFITNTCSGKRALSRLLQWTQ